MSQLFPPEIIENTVECYHAQISAAIIDLILPVILLVFAHLIEEGTHISLFRVGTRYHEMWQKQLPDFI